MEKIKPVMMSQAGKMERTLANKVWQRGQFFFAALLFLSSLFFIYSYSHFMAFNAKALGKYFPFKWVLAGHIAGGATALLTGPVQFLKAFRMQFRRVHRVVGRIYLLAILISGLSAFVLTLTTTNLIGLAYTHSLQALIFAWFFTTYTAFSTILKGQISLHQQWMVRSYICSFAFIVQNYLLKIPILTEAGSFAELSPTVIWCSWSIPMLLYQRLLHSHG